MHINCMYLYIKSNVYRYMCIYIYICRERERVNKVYSTHSDKIIYDLNDVEYPLKPETPWLSGLCNDQELCSHTAMYMNLVTESVR